MRAAVLASVFLLAVVPACTGSRAQDRLGVATSIEEAFPALEGTTLDGVRFDPASLDDRVVLVNFWATWCGPCRQEQPELNGIEAEYGDRGLAVVGVNERDDPAAARAWVEEFDVAYPSIVDEPGAFADDFDFVGLPATYLVDRAGTMRYRIFGRFRLDELRELIEELLAEPAAG